MKPRLLLALLSVLILAHIALAKDEQPKYWRVGNPNDVSTNTSPGYSLMGGGTDQDEAFKFLCEKSGGGDFLILRASGDDDYNSYVRKLCPKLNSVATLLIATAQAAQDPMVVKRISEAEALFIAGGDQAHYVLWWKPSPMREAMQKLIDRGVPVGGTSAGLAILGEFSFAALHDTAYSAESLKNPYNEGVTIDRGFLSIPQMKNTITDTHFKKRDRLGRTLVFMARILQDGMAKQVRAIAVDEKSAALLEPNGQIRVIGAGSGAYFYRPSDSPEECKPDVPLSWSEIPVYHAPTGASFDLATWRGSGGSSYVLHVQNGVIHSSTGSNY